MIAFSVQTGLMLVAATLFLLPFSATHAHNHYPSGHRNLAVRSQTVPTSTSQHLSGTTASACTGASCIGASPISSTLPCSQANGTTIVAGSESSIWTMLCDIDFFAQDIYPFFLAESFEECLQHCEDHNQQRQDSKCAGFVFAPDRVHSDNDCYLKSSLNDAIYPSTIHLVGATLVYPPSATSTVSIAQVTPSQPVNKGSDAPTEDQSPLISQAVALGTSVHKPTDQYVKHPPALPMKLATSLLKPGVNVDLITKYPLARDTGSWTTDAILLSLPLANLSITPRLSRDGGKGGNINGTHIFVFCDTSTFGDTETAMGYMNGFVSSSAAVDLYQNATHGEALTLQDPIGQWQDDVGRLRGWIEMTTGEEAFNIAVSGEGYRYAVWPESSLISLNASHALLYAPIVYVQVNMTTQSAIFESLGNTLTSVSVDANYGPHADRLVNQLFTQNEVEWGSLGGLRAWGKSGVGAMDGMLYLFGKVDGGVLVAKVAPSMIEDRSAYVYWNGSAWSPDMQPPNSIAYLINQPVMDFDVFYSPFHKYFIMVYLTPYADNTFWMRYTRSAAEPILPPYVSGGTEDYCERILDPNIWSEPVVLWQADAPAVGYIYAGGVHAGYFGAEDITTGGNSLLITWTEHTEKDPSDPSSGYAHKSARIEISKA